MPRMWLRSDAFLTGGPLGKRYLGSGDNISPALKWGDIPDSALELAVLCEDLDAGALPSLLWSIYKISADDPGVPEGVAPVAKPEDPAGALQGKNSFGGIGYTGPNPQRGGKPHRIRFTLFAIKNEIDYPAELRREALERMFGNHIVAQCSLECKATLG